MYDYKADVAGTLARAVELREATLADGNLSDAGKRAQLARLVDPLEASAAQSAGAWLAQLERAGARAEAAHRDARRRAAELVDHGKREHLRTLALERIEYGAWDDVARGIDDALELGDVDGVAVWHELGNRVRAKYDTGAGPASDPHTGVVSYMARVSAAAEAAEPAEVRETREALTTAADALTSARAYLDTQDHVRERFRGAAPLFRDALNPRGEPVVEDMGNGRYAIGGVNIWR